jgi:hypothetical protein
MIPLIAVILYVLTIYILCKGIFAYNRRINRLNELKEVKNTYKPKL